MDVENIARLAQQGGKHPNITDSTDEGRVADKKTRELALLLAAFLWLR
jgi:hypothetical protein